MRLLILAVCIVLLPIHANAQWSQNGQSTPDAPNKKSSDGFGAQLLVISHLSEFIKEWTATSPDHVPRVPVVTKVKRGKPVAIILFFAGCKADTSGRCTAVYDLTIERPDGSTLKRFSDLELWNMEPPPNIQLGLAIPQMQFDKSDPRGTYHIKANVRDQNRRIALQLETTVDVE